MLPLPGTPAEARLGGGSAAATTTTGRAPASEGDDAATMRLDMGDLARMRQVPPDGAGPADQAGDAGGAGAPVDGAPAGDGARAPAGQAPAGQAPGGQAPVAQGQAPVGQGPAGGPPPAGQAPGRPPAGPPPGGPPGGAPPPPPPASQPEEEAVDDTAREAVAGLDDEVLVIDEEPLFHLGRCSYLYGREVIPLPVSEAVELGFTGCSWCTPVASLSGPRSADSRR